MSHDHDHAGHDHDEAGHEHGAGGHAGHSHGVSADADPVAGADVPGRAAERGGKLVAARIYDDSDPPLASHA